VQDEGYVVDPKGSRETVPGLPLQRNMTEMQPPGDHGHPLHDEHQQHGAELDAPCRHAHEHREHAAEALARAERVCRERGLRLTPIRRQALEALHGDHRPVGAYDLADRISPPGGRRLAPISIYRALDFLVEQGFVHRLSSRNAYVACLHGHGADEVVAFLICEDCGGVDEDSSPAMRQAVAAITSGRHFAPSHQVVEIVGRCEHCRNVGASRSIAP
jgi:Fur family zinc uptake transcriptional regulator